MGISQAPFGRIRLDGSRFPLVVITVPARPDPAQIPAVYREYDELLARGPHGLLIDFRAMHPLSATTGARRVILAEVEARETVFRHHLVAEVRLVKDRLTRRIVTAYEWMRNRTYSFPLLTTDSEDEAYRWLEDTLRR